MFRCLTSKATSLTLVVRQQICMVWRAKTRRRANIANVQAASIQRFVLNLETDHTKLLEIYHAVDELPEIKKSFIGSGVRYDLLLHKSKDEKSNEAAKQYTHELITRHVSGRLKGCTRAYL